MSQVRTMQLVGEAKRSNVGVAAFNVIHIETAEALVAASERAQLPLILQLSHNCVRYHGSFDPIGHAMLDIANCADTPVAVILITVNRNPWLVRPSMLASAR